ncbi:MAG: OmpH family outer membrane protein [Flavobacteriales bacterium]|nr:OmpH family outer membrane protein [Flavobacteriales bacterium]
MNNTGKIALIVAAVCAVLTAVLFYQTAELKKQIQKEEIITPEASIEEPMEKKGPLKIGFVVGDSINANYKFVLDKRDDLIAKATASEKRIERKLKAAQAKEQEYVNYFQSVDNVTAEDQAVAQNDMMQLEYELQALQQQEENKLAKAELEFQTELFEKLGAYLERFSEENGYDMVFNYGFGSQTLLYSSDAHDVTDMVVKGLNAEYAAEQLAQAPATDGQ